MEFCIEIGGVTVKICHRYGYIKKLCRDYITDKTSAFSVYVTDEQIAAVFTTICGMCLTVI